LISNIGIRSIKSVFVILFIIILSACAKEQESGMIVEGAKLHFVVQEGQIYNEFYRQGPVAAHTVLTSGPKPRLIVAFPAGNSGVSLWFKEMADSVKWQTVENMTGVLQYNEGGDPLYGIEAVLTVSAAQLILDKAVLGNIRTIRDHMHGVKIPEIVETKATVKNNKVTWSRDRLDKRGGYKLSVEVVDGELIRGEASSIVFKANKAGKLRLHIVALTGDTPLTPIESGALLNEKAADDLVSRQILSFLTYKEKMLAGSWRFLTYFGRDTLLSLRMLMPVLKPEAIEAGLGSVIERLDSNGDVAHEEDIGEFAILRHLKGNGEALDAPIFDYKMVDDDYMLSTIVAHYLLSHKDRAGAFLARKTVRGQTYGDALIDNMEFVLKTAKPFAKSPVASNLVAIKQGIQVGEWRDSNEGLGGGIYAYSVNAVFVPAALEAIVRLKNSTMLDRYMEDKTIFSQAESYSQVWQEKAPQLFKVSLSASAARQKVVENVARLSLPEDTALSSLDEEEVGFYGVSLDEGGNVIPIINSDVGFMMLFNTPTADEIEYALQGIMRPFPAGLMTPVGLVVANAVYAPEDLKRTFTNGHYHGSVIWSWQQALLAAGLERQLMRIDLPEVTRQLIMGYQNDLWQVIKEGKKIKTSELWSWAIVNNEFTISLFGQGKGHSIESNAAQLWSTVYLAVQPPVHN